MKCKIKEISNSEWRDDVVGLGPCIECCFSIRYRHNKLLCNGHHPDTCLELRKLFGINEDRCKLIPRVKHYEMQIN